MLLDRKCVYLSLFEAALKILFVYPDVNPPLLSVERDSRTPFGVVLEGQAPLLAQT